ncbi:MAG: (2Fe-2S)-binding protein [Thermodesulfobacteriota bacterium]
MADLRLGSINGREAITVRINGQETVAYRGEMVHAVLLAAGHRILRKTKSSEGRGFFCGMGVCYDCLVTIDGVPGRRACMTEVRDQMEITVNAP